MNTALIRRRIRDTRLKVIQKQIGTRSKTDYALMYIEDLVQKDILNKVQKQMDKICVDGIFDSGMLQQYLEKDSKTPFPLYQLTQRPDKVASSIMEGRIAVVLDNSPMVLLLPVTLNVFFQASDDYYNRWEITTFVRILRYMAAIISMAELLDFMAIPFGKGGVANAIFAGVDLGERRSSISGNRGGTADGIIV